jgi:hypothetical protein
MGRFNLASPDSLAAYSGTYTVDAKAVSSSGSASTSAENEREPFKRLEAQQLASRQSFP